MSAGSALHYFHAPGKLLLSAEYFVLDGALALALPCRLGQSLSVFQSVSHVGRITWGSLNQDGTIWFRCQFGWPAFRMLESSSAELSDRLLKIFQLIESAQPSFFKILEKQSIHVVTQLDFDRTWGLGSSSTLIANIGRWADLDSFWLQQSIFGGSGYDIACAMANGPILYRRKEQRASFTHIPFRPNFTENLYFVYLGQKQNSRSGIAHYRSRGRVSELIVGRVDQLTQAMLRAANLQDFEAIIQEHEDLVGDFLQLRKAKEIYFEDYWGAVKSLGAWGGDFVLVTSDRPAEETRQYFKQKGHSTIFEYKALII